MSCARNCWCGNLDLLQFGPDYAECKVCGTLVSQKGLSDAELSVNNDDSDFYGKQYWLDHQSQDLSFPDIRARSRNDITERNLHWLNILLKYRLPPALTLELGCAHASFVALAQQAGYRASGVEMSPWVVAFGKKEFNVPVYQGPIESLDCADASLDVIILMDVLEHLPHPLATMTRCLRLLRLDGFFLIQTPEFKEEYVYETLTQEKSRFLEQLKADEHIYLFSKRSVTEFFRRIGAEHLYFEPAIFSHYDMFFTVSRSPLTTHEADQITAALQATSSGRIVLALLDVRERELVLTRKLDESEIDRKSRWDQIASLSTMLESSERDRTLRAAQIDSLTAMIEKVEAARVRLHNQLDSLSAQLKKSESDRLMRAEQIHSLTDLINESNADRTARAQQIEALTTMLAESEADRNARAPQIEQLTATLAKSEADRKARAQQIETLTAMLKESEADREARAQQIATLTTTLKKSEADREARAEQIKSLTSMFKESEVNRTAGVQEITTLAAACDELRLTQAAHVERMQSLEQSLHESENNLALSSGELDALVSDLRALSMRRGFRRLAKIMNWPEADKLFNQFEDPHE